eukprot:393150-Alexandrium_andersonii.AAC.1
MCGGGTLAGGAFPALLGRPLGWPASGPGPALGAANCAAALSPVEPERLPASPETLDSEDPE